MGHMINKIEDFGRNAGIIWETLNSHGALTQTNLIIKTKLKDDEFYTGAGWDGYITIMDVDTKEHWHSDYSKDLYGSNQGR